MPPFGRKPGDWHRPMTGFCLFIDTSGSGTFLHLRARGGFRLRPRITRAPVQRKPDLIDVNAWRAGLLAHGFMQPKQAFSWNM